MMLELLAYAFLLLFVMPALLLGMGKLISHYGTELTALGGVERRAARPAPLDYRTLNQRLDAAAKANPLVPRISFRRGKAPRKSWGSTLRG